MFLLDLSTAPEVGPVADWLAAKPTTRWVGAVYSEARAQEYLHSADPRREMDILAFVETTSAARANPLGRRPAWSRHEPEAALAKLQLAGAGEVQDSWTSSGNWRQHGHAVGLSDEPSPGGGPTVRIARASAPWRWGRMACTDGRRRISLRQAFALQRRHVCVCEAGADAQLYIETRPKYLPARYGLCLPTILA
jgi:hypothetical protein